MIWIELNYIRDFPGGSDGKESACSAGDLVWSLGSSRVRPDWMTNTHTLTTLLDSYHHRLLPSQVLFVSFIPQIKNVGKCGSFRIYSSYK